MAHGASTAIANGFFVLEDGINIAALAVGSIPEYSGSGDSEAGIAPAGRYYFSGLRYAELLGPELSININDAEALQYGPRFQYRFGREDVDDDAQDSPIVDLRGDRDQRIYGIGMGYVWQ